MGLPPLRSSQRWGTLSPVRSAGGGSTGILARAVARRTSLALVGLVLLIGVGGGAVLATFAVAHRTATAHDRMIAATEAWDVLVNPNNGSESKLDPEAVRRLPQVKEMGRIDGLALINTSTGELVPLPFLPDELGARLGRPLVTAGRLPDPTQGDEVLVDREWAIQEGIDVGDLLPVVSFTVPEVAQLDTPGATPDTVRAAVEEGRLGRRLDLRVVGLGLTFTNVIHDEGEDSASVMLTPAFPHLVSRTPAELSMFYGLLVRLRSPADLPALRAAINGMVPDESFAYQTLAAVRDQVQRTVRPLVVSLTAVAAAAAVLVLVLAAVVMTRILGALATDQRQWWVLGAGRRQRVTGLGAGLGVAVLTGAALAVVVAWLLSSFGPVGPVRIAEPDPGLRFDPLVLLGGALVLVLTGLGLVAFVSWRGSRIRSTTAARTSRVVQRAASVGLPQTFVVGLRNAMAGPGAIGAALVAVAVGAAVLTFSSGVKRFTDTPSLYGWNWDALVALDNEAPPEEIAAIRAGLMGNHDAQDVALVTLSDVSLDGRVVVTAAFEPVKGTLEPTVAAGRPPRSEMEVALGERTMRDLGVGMGDQVTTADGRRLNVVGRVVLPGFANYPGADKTAVGEGAVVQPDVLAALGPRFSPYGFAVHLAGGATKEDLGTLPVGPDGKDPIATEDGARPSDVIELGDLDRVPFLLAGVLALLALVVAVHAVWTAVQRRRREHAVLRALGWRPRESRRCVLWHATVIMIAAVVLGLPVGLVVGRWVWGRLARFLGTVTVSVAPMGVLLAAAAVFVLVAIAGAAVPARRASLQRPTEALRAE
jgi:FtsX-like permease family protein